LIGLALGSGAAFGLAHIGVLRVLEKNKIPVDILSGSSIGAFVAAMWGIGLSSEKIERLAQKLTNKINIMKLLDFTVPISGILAGRKMKMFLRSILGEKTFEDLKIPVKIMVYDLANREVFAVEKGTLADAVYMSIAVPGIFKPKVERERVLIDGGVSDPVPVDILLKEGVKKIIAVNVLPGPEEIHERNRLIKGELEKEERLLQDAPVHIRYKLCVKRFFRKIFSPNIFDVIMTSMQAIEYILAEGSCKKASVALRPVLSKASSTDFCFLKEFIERGEEEANQHIKEIEKLF
ncbi:patatin-like phospholipase family protein, partial [Candidatus Omnitrophota bacterium]